MNDILIKKDTESIDDYIERIIRLKNEMEMTWDDVRDIANEQTGLSLGSDSYRKREAKRQRIAKELNESREAKAEIEPTTTTTTQTSADLVSNSYEAFKETDTDDVIALKKERIKISDERTQNNSYIRRIAREETIRDIAHDYAVTMNLKGKLTPTRKFKTTYDKDLVGLLCVSDWHYGIDIDNIYNQYSPEIAKRRIQQLQDETVKRLTNPGVERLVVLNLGDLIAGNIHLQIRLESRMDVISEIMQISELYAQMLANLSEHFDITTYSVLDNHSRIDPNKKDAMQLETLARITDWYLKERLKGFPIKIEPNTFDIDIATFEILGHKILGVHGDKDKQNRMIDTLSMFTQNHYDLICSAHLHHFSANESNNTLLLSNGSMMGTDDFAFGLRLNSKPSQNLIIVSKDNVCEELHRIVLD